MLRRYSHSIGVCFFILKLSPGQRPYKDLYSFNVFDRNGDTESKGI